MIIALLCALLAWLPGYRLDLALGDALATRFAPPSPAAEDIVVVAIDEATLAKLNYRSPIDRGLLADLVAKIDAAGAKAIGIDILFDQPTEAAKDQRLRAALGNTRARLVVAHAGEGLGLTPAQSAFLKRYTAPHQPGLVELVADDVDGRVRWFTWGGPDGGRWIPGFAAALAGRTTPPSAGQARIERFLPSPARADRPQGFAVYPAQAVALLPDAWFTGKYVLIGADLPHEDRHRWPYANDGQHAHETMPGVLVHAHTLAHILAPHRVIDASLPATLAAALAAALLAALIMLLAVSPPLRWLLLAGLIALSGFAAVLLFQAHLVILPLATTTLAALIAATGLSLDQWVRDRNHRLFIENAFAQYVGRAVAREVAAAPEKLRLGGERRTVTVIFTDLEGFTGLTERLPPDQLVELLNAYLDGLCDAFISAGATIDKIVGDAVVGFFGAPRDQPDQARRAADLALAIDAFSEDFRARAREQGISLGATRIGLHKGDAVIGNFGGARFFDYTGIGDTMNTAARLEAANRHFATRICASEAIVRDCPNHHFRPIGSVLLKGKSTALPCFELVAPAAAASAEAGAYRDGFDLIATDPAAARAAFEALRHDHPGDGLVAFQLERLRAGATGTLIRLEEK